MQIQRRWCSFLSTLIMCLFSISEVSCLPIAKTRRECSGNPANIIFVLDSSSSVWVVDYNKQLSFVQKVVEPFDIGPSDSHVHVGAITFSNDSHLEFSLDKYTNKDDLKEAILNIPYRHGETNTAAALRMVRNEIETHKKENSAPFMVVVITDGMSSNTSATVMEADLLHQLDVTVYAIGVGYYFHLSELTKIASRHEYVYTVTSYSSLKSIIRMFNIKTCREIVLTTTPKPTTKAPTTTTTTTPAPPKPAPAKATAGPTTTTTTPAPTTTTTTPAPTTTTTTPAPTTTTTTPAPTTTTTTPAPTTTTTTPAPTTTTLPPTLVPITAEIEETATETELLQRDDSSTVAFGYDLVAMGAYRAQMIERFINNLLPHTDFGNVGVVSYAYCPQNFNVPVTSLMDKKPADTAQIVAVDNKVPSLVDVVRQMRQDLNDTKTKKNNKSHVGNKVGVLFLDTSVSTITPDLLLETNRLKKDGSKLFLVNVGDRVWYQPQYLYSMSSQPAKDYIYNYTTYDKLLETVKRNPSIFKTLSRKDTSKN